MPIKSHVVPTKAVHVLNWEALRNYVATWVCGIQNLTSEASLLVSCWQCQRVHPAGKILYQMLHNCSVRKEPHPKAKLLTKKSAGARLFPGSEWMLKLGRLWGSQPPQYDRLPKHGPNVCLISGMGSFALDIVEDSQFLLMMFLQCL